MILQVGDKVKVKEGSEKSEADKGKSGVVESLSKGNDRVGVLFDGEEEVNNNYYQIDLETAEQEKARKEEEKAERKEAKDAEKEAKEADKSHHTKKF
jgi:hypothetical protein